MSSLSRPSSIVIVGSGPAGLCAAAALVDRAPHLRNCLSVVDPSGSWLATWMRQFEAQDITHLRSASVHHPDPAPYALLDFSRDPQRVGDESSGFVLDGGFDLPTTNLFDAFCTDVIDRYELAPLVRRGCITSAGVCDQDAGGGVTVTLDSGDLIEATHVIHAGNPRARTIPQWATPVQGQSPDPRIRHSSTVDLRVWVGEGRRVLVVGGGLTAVQLAVGAALRDSPVVLASRRPLTIRQFDVEPGWLGPRELDPFCQVEDWTYRRALVDLARGGGSVPPFAARLLRAAIEAGRVRHREGFEVDTLAAGGSSIDVTWAGGGSDQFDEIWLATGSRPDAESCPVLSQIQRQRPALIVDGLPVVDHDMRWPGTDTFLVGALTALHLGPTAGILFGQRRAAERIATAITGQEPTRATRRDGFATRNGATRP